MKTLDLGQNISFKKDTVVLYIHLAYLVKLIFPLIFFFFFLEANLLTLFYSFCSRCAYALF
jgi:hypothetical protein